MMAIWGDALMFAVRGRDEVEPKAGLNAWLSKYPELN
jgi:hypothetical protein